MEFENVYIDNLKFLVLPESDEYKGGIHPYHAVNAGRFRDSHFHEFVEKGIKAKGIQRYVPMDLRDDGVHDLIFDERDNELSFLFETQPSLTRLGVESISTLLILEHSPDKAQGQYFMMPFTFAFYIDKAKSRIYYRLIPALSILPEKKSLELSLKYAQKLEMGAKMVFDRPDFQYLPTPDITAEIERRKGDVGIRELEEAFEDWGNEVEPVTDGKV